MDPSIDIVTDGCTAGPLSDYLNSLAYECCRAHDLAYAHGVTVADKFAADASLWLCVVQHGHPIWATLMLVAVATAGWLWWLRRPN